MTLPVSSYEELLARVRSLTSETIQLRREITSSLCDHTALSTDDDNCPAIKICGTHPRSTSTCEERNPFIGANSLCLTTAKETRPGSVFDRKENEFDNEFKEIDEKLSSPDVAAFTKNSIHGNGWATDNFALWHSGPSSLSVAPASNNNFSHQNLTSSVTCTSYESQSLNNFSCASKRTYSHQQLGAKVEMVYSLLSMLDTDNREDMSKTFLAMSSSPESCHAMRQSGCLPLLIQLIHSSELNAEVRNRAAEALHNIVHSQTDEKRRRREVRVLKLLQQVREYCDELKNFRENKSLSQEDSEKHPVSAVGTLMKFSFDAEHRQAICVLGGLYAITDLIQVEHETHDSASDDSLCITLRRYAGMSLTNLTFGDGKNKALLCSFNKFMRALVDQLKSPSEELRQVTASVLRNLSWRADEESKQVLRNVGAVTALTVSAMEGKKESTLKSILSALWNLSAHCSLNKIDISSVPGALAFLVKMLRYKSSSNTLAIVENAGGILRNISSHIAVREDYRQILRDNNCFEVLLEQLKSPSLTIVSNACGTLWNLSARCPEDQKRLWEMGATTMLRSLIQSKHKMISMGSSAALKNLLAANPNKNFVAHLDSTAKSLGLQNLPTLFVRKKKALEQELNITLAETCENIEGIGSPSHACTTQDKIDEKSPRGPMRSDSRDSVRSTQSDSVYERLNQIVLQNQEKLFENNNITLHDSLSEKTIPRKLEEQKLIRRYKTSMIPLRTLKKSDQNRKNEKTKNETCIAEDEHCFKEDSKDKINKGIPLFKMTPLDKSSSSIESFKYNRGETTGIREESLINLPDLGETFNSQVAYNLLVGEDSRNFNRHKTNEEKEYENKNCEGSFDEAKSTRTLNASVIENPTFCITESRVSFENQSYCNNNLIESIKEITKDSRQKCGTVKSHESVPVNICRDSAQLKSRFQTNQFGNDPKVRVGNILGEPAIDSIPQEVASEHQEGTSQILQPPLSLEFGIGVKVLSTYQEAYPSPAESLTKMENAAGTAESCGSDCQKSELHFEEVGRNQSGVVDEADKYNDSKKPKENLTPDFKIGSPITDSKVLQYEASKICREISRHQELDMGCSLTSEVSLISCSSFLDTAECSLLECSSDGIEFDESENQHMVKEIIKTNSLNFRKTTIESVSLPSLGSFKNEQIEALELDSSVLSIASFTSEIADAEVKDLVCNTYTKTSKNDDCQEQTIEDSSFPDGDETLNADSLQNNKDDDSSLHCQENLPLDSEIFEDVVNDEVAKKLTPKEKRKTFCERYRTYTIKDLRFVQPSMSMPEVSDERENLENGATPDSFDDDLREQYHDEYRNPNEEKPFIFKSPPATVHRENRVDSYHRFSKSFDRVQNSFPVGMSDSKSLNDLLIVGPYERKELVDNAKLVAFSLKTAVHDFDAEIVSDSEGDELQNSLTIDTATYSKNNRPTYSPEELRIFHGHVNRSTDNLDKKGARVLKSDEKLESPKGIRGRRKPLYSSCQKNFRTVDLNLPKCSPKTVTDAKLSKPILHREGTFTIQGLATKKTEAKIIRTIPVLNRNSEFKSSIPKLGVRNASAPALGISGTSKAMRPLPTCTPKINERRNESDSFQKRFVPPTGNPNKTPWHGYSSKRHPAANLPSQNTTPLGNQNIKTGGPGPALRPRSAALQNLKSQSDANLHLVVAQKDKVAAGKLKTPKKEVTSKIASLWRKVEETKQQNKNLKDKRLWIGPGENEEISNDVLVVQQQEIVKIPKRQIMHGLTYGSLTDEITEQNTFCGESSNEIKTGTERRSIVSAVVQPYNYNPPASTDVTSTNLKQVDSFHKGSLKVTTV